MGDAWLMLGRRFRVCSKAKGGARGAFAAVFIGAMAGACGPAQQAETPPSATTADPEAKAAPSGSAASSGAASSGAASSGAMASSATPSTPGSSAPSEPKLPAVSMVQVEASPVGKPPSLGVMAPSKGLLISMAKAPVYEVKVSAKNFAPSAGEHLCVFFDKKACRVVTDVSKAIRLGDLGPLDEGQHVISVLARRATGEFYRGVNKAVPFASVSFFVGKKTAPVHKDGSPMLFYSPIEKGPAKGGSFMLDFFVANGTVGEGQFVVTASVGGPGIESGGGLAMKENKPLVLQDVRPGEYISRFRLLQFIPELGDSKAATITVSYKAVQVPGPFGEIERSFVVTKAIP